MRHSSITLAALAFSLSFLPASPLQAQDEPAAEPAAAESSAAAVKPATPHAAEMAVKAAKNPLLRVVKAGKRYVAVGARGHILISDDGETWTQVASPVDVLLTSVNFADASNGWAVGHDAAILHTSDGGQTWQQQNYQPDLNKPLFDVLFLDAQNGFAVGAYGLMLETRDGGGTWTPMASNPVNAEERHLNALTRLGDGSIMVIGEAGTIGISADRGSTWEKLATPYESSLFCVIPAGDKGALIGGLRGNSFYSADVRSGPWKKMETNTDQSLFGMAALPSNQIAMVGLNATLLFFEPGKPARSVPITDKAGNRQTDTLSWLAIAPNGALIVVGDNGVQTVDAGKR